MNRQTIYCYLQNTLDSLLEKLAETNTKTTISEDVWLICSITGCQTIPRAFPGVLMIMKIF